MRRFVMTAVLLSFGTLAHADKPMGAAAAAPGTEPATGKTCGQMLKEKAAYPAKMAELLDAVVQNIELHIKWMQAEKTKESKAEADGLRKIAKTHKDLANAMRKTAAEMEKVGDKMPAAKHDPALMPPESMEAMKKQAKLDREMAKLLEQDAAQLQ